MKFLLGVMIGAVVVLALAEYLPANPREWGEFDFGKWKEAVREGVQAPPPNGSEVLVAQESTDAVNPSIVQEKLQDAPLPEEVLVPVALDDEAVEEVADEVAEKEEVETPSEEIESLPASPVPEPVSTDSGEKAVADFDTAQTARLWTSFYSERSATGFARQLEKTLGGQFEVERQSAQEYWVTYAYANLADLTRVQSHLIAAFGEPEG